MKGTDQFKVYTCGTNGQNVTRRLCTADVQRKRQFTERFSLVFRPDVKIMFRPLVSLKDYLNFAHFAGLFICSTKKTTTKKISGSQSPYGFNCTYQACLCFGWGFSTTRVDYGRMTGEGLMFQLLRLMASPSRCWVSAK